MKFTRWERKGLIRREINKYFNINCNRKEIRIVKPKLGPQTFPDPVIVTKHSLSNLRDISVLIFKLGSLSM